MKINKFLKITVLILSLTLVLGLAFALSIGAEGETPETKIPEIVSQNVAYKGNFALIYAVDASTVNEGPVKLYLYDKNPDTDSTASILRVYTAEDITLKSDEKYAPPVDSYIFETDGVAADSMVDYYYVKAVDNTGAASAVKRYSVAEYLYQRLANFTSTKAQKELYNAVIEFGDDAQILLKGLEENSPELISNLRYVTVENGKLSDGYSAGVYQKGKTLALADTKSYWSNVAYNSVGDFTTEAINSGSFTVKDVAKNNITTNAINYRDGVDTLNDHEITGEVFTYGAGTTLNGLSTTSNDLKYTFKSDAEHGTFFSLDLSVSPRLQIHQTSTLPEGTKATAFECSYDLQAILKDDWASNISGKTINMRLILKDANGTTISGECYLYWYQSSSKNSIAVQKGDYSVATVAQEDWFRVRTVVYEGDNNMYVYINNNPIHIGKVALKSGYTMADVDKGGMFGYYYTTDPYNNSYAIEELHIDNIFCGFTTDTKEDTSYIQGNDGLLRGYAENVLTKDKGEVLKFSFPENVPSKEVKFAINDTEVSAGDATAFEATFDMKMVVPEGANSTAFTIAVQKSGGQNWFRNNIYYDTEKARIINSSGSGSGAKEFPGIDTTEWVKIRLVIYKNSPYCYIYINDEPEPFINYKTNSESYVFDGSDITGFINVVVLPYANPMEGLEVYLDNVVCGFTDATLAEDYPGASAEQ